MKMNLKKEDSNSVDLQNAFELLEKLGPAAMYAYLERFGDRYARLANGVVNGDSIGGNAALRHMTAVAQEHGKTLSDEQVNLVRHNMAKAYLKLLEARTNKGNAELEPTWREALAFHKQVFKDLDLPPEAWTLYTPFDVCTDEQNAQNWGSALAAAGDPVKETALSVELYNMMRVSAGIYINEGERQAFQNMGLRKDLSIDQMRGVLKWLAGNTSGKNIGEAGNVAISTIGEQFAKLATLLAPDGNNDLVKALFEALLPEYLLSVPQIGDRIDALFASTGRMSSPLILDLDGNGVQTLGLSAGVHFDHDGNRFAEGTGWVGPNDGMLVLDRNGNGVIDDGRELFGNNTLLPDGQQAVNGFAALAALDSNQDGKIDAADELFSSLRVWRDSNSDGVTGDDEFLTLEQAGVASIGLKYAGSSATDPEGNRHFQAGSFTRVDGSRGDVHDVWFKVDAVRSKATELLVEDATVSAMPDITGVGNVHSLHQAMMRDDTGKLIALVSQFSSTSDAVQQFDLTSDILMAWTGADRYAKNSRGSYMPDARRIYVMEALVGRAFVQGGWGSSPGGDASGAINKGYDDLVRSIRAHLIMQTHIKPLLTHVTLDFEHGGVLDVSGVVDTLQAQYEQSPDQALAQLRQLTTVLEDLGSPMSLAIMGSLKKSGDSLGAGVLRELAVSTKAAHSLSVKTESKDRPDFAALRSADDSNVIDARSSDSTPAPAADSSDPAPITSLRTMSHLMASSTIPATPAQPGEASAANAFFANAATAFASAMVAYAPRASVISGMKVNDAQMPYATLSVGHR